MRGPLDPPATPLVEDQRNVDAGLLRFLLDPTSYLGDCNSVRLIESHMSLVFLAADRAYKMKKPIRLNQVDYRTLDARRRNCERELALNSMLAPDVYLGLATVRRDDHGKLHWEGSGQIVEWLVVMRRLEDDRLLDHAIARGVVSREDISALVATLGPFYAMERGTPPPASALLDRWADMIDRSSQSLCAIELGLPDHEVVHLLNQLSGFLKEQQDLLKARLEAGWIRDCHGDLRPEHVYLGPPLRLIDRLEFDDQLRWCDPFEEIVDLGLECERMGAAWIMPMLLDGLAASLGSRPEPAILGFYAGLRAALRARLAIDHLKGAANGRAERWRARAIAGLDLGRKYLLQS